MTANATRLRSPFPWFGGKSRVAHIVWEAFGDTPNYVEPFFGSGAVLLNRPQYDAQRHTETINDLDCFVANFWRAVQHSPDEVARWADNPVNEADLHARHLWLVNQNEFRESMKVDPDFYDPKIAGWWVWGQCSWIGAGWCSATSAGRGVNRQLPHLGDAGMGVNRKLPHLGGAGRGIYDYFDALCDRLRRVRVACGDWSRIVTPAVAERNGVTAVFLDPPYSGEIRTKNLYTTDSDDVAVLVRQWAIANGANPELRIALCGYDREHEMPEDWICIEWKANGGYSNQSNSNENAAKERIWFSPHCLLSRRQKQQLTIFEI